MGASENLLAAFECVPVGLVVLTPDLAVEYANKALFTLLESPANKAKGLLFCDAFSCTPFTPKNKLCPGSKDCLSCPMQLLRLSDADSTGSFEAALTCATGAVKHFIVNSSVIHDKKILLAFTDITASKSRETALSAQLSIDAVTGAASKTSVIQSIEALLKNKKSGSVAFIDIDNFKDINDTRGHLVGDKTLKLFCTCALNHVRDGDILGRFGGDEFMLVLPGTDLEKAISAIRRIRDKFVIEEEREFDIIPSFSVGITSFGTNDGTDITVDDIISNADFYLYNAKKKGKDKIATKNGIFSFNTAPEISKVI